MSSEGFQACHTYCNTGHLFIMVISKDPWHSNLLPSCHYLFLLLRSNYADNLYAKFIYKYLQIDNTIVHGLLKLINTQRVCDISNSLYICKIIVLSLTKNYGFFGFINFNIIFHPIVIYEFKFSYFNRHENYFDNFHICLEVLLAALLFLFFVMLDTR